MTQTDLYRSITHDQASHHRTITAALHRQSSARRRIVTLYSKGFSDRQCGAQTHRTHGACRAMLLRTMWAVNKQALRLPRYHLTGRARKHPAPIGAPREPDPRPQPTSWRDHLSPAEKRQF